MHSVSSNEIFINISLVILFIAVNPEDDRKPKLNTSPHATRETRYDKYRR